MKKVTPKKYAIGLYEALQGVPEDQAGEFISNFVSLLARNKDISQAKKIIKAYKEYANQQEGVIELTMTSAEKFDQDVKENIIKQLTSSLNKKVEINESVDPSLIGGAKLQYGDTVIDGSVKKRLELLADSLKQ